MNEQKENRQYGRQQPQHPVPTTPLPAPLAHTPPLPHPHLYPHLRHLCACDDSLLAQLLEQSCEWCCLGGVVKQTLNSSLDKLVVVVGQGEVLQDLLGLGGWVGLGWVGGAGAKQKSAPKRGGAKATMSWWKLCCVITLTVCTNRHSSSPC